MTQTMDKAVIMARGLGTRMRRRDDQARLSADQLGVAASGLKAMIPIGRPFLDYVLAALADAGYRQVCVVIGPEHDAVRDYYTRQAPPARIAIDFAIQQQPLGTADAVAAAESFAGGDPFLVINSDNYYPVEALRPLRELDGMGLAAFDRDGLLSGGNIPAERIARYAVLETDENRDLRSIIEKPGEELLARMPRPLLVSMNCWRLGPEIFPACRAIGRSPRGELELIDAIEYCRLKMGIPFRVLTVHAPVLDLSQQSDIESVAEFIKNKPADY